MDPILESFKIKEELKNRQALNKLGKTTKAFKCDKFLPATKEQKYFLICEGLSASSGLSACLGRNTFGYYSTRGVPLNAYEAQINKLVENVELSDMIKLLNLQFKNEEQDLTYDNIVIAADADADGSHIIGLYIGLYAKYFPSIIKNKNLHRLRTPLIALKDSKDNIKHFFFTLDEYNLFLASNDISKYKLQYYKGLGSWEPKDLKPLVEKFGIEYFLETFILDEEGNITIDNWLNGKNADKRKEYLNDIEFNLFNIGGMNI